MTLRSPPNVFPTKPITAFQTFPNISDQNKLRPFTFRLISSPLDKQLKGITTDIGWKAKTLFNHQELFSEPIKCLNLTVKV